MTKERAWVTFGDLEVGEKFRFTYGFPPGTGRKSDVMIKISPRRYRTTDGRVAQTRAATAVIVVIP